jgi:hypothetical protein
MQPQWPGAQQRSSAAAAYQKKSKKKSKKKKNAFLGGVPKNRTKKLALPYGSIVLIIVGVLKVIRLL